MDIEMLVRLDACGLKHTGPINAVGLQDIFGSNVLNTGPKFLKQLTIWITQG
jgi:hypothetical protein